MNKTIVHLIGGLGKGSGGAEKVLSQVICNTKEFKNIVITFREGNCYRSQIISCGAEIIEINLNYANILKFIKLAYLLITSINKYKVDVIIGWMYHGSLIAGILGIIFRRKKIIWWIHNAELDDKITKRITILIAKICGSISNSFNRNLKIIYCGERSRKVHEKNLFFNKSKGLIIYNGIDIVKSSCSELIIKKKDDNLIKLIHVARYHPVKDHDLLINVFNEIEKRGINWSCELIGPGLGYNNEIIKEKLRKNKLLHRVKLLGSIKDVFKRLKNSDIHILTSRNEAFPLVVIEAIYCGCISVTTDIGDCNQLSKKYSFVAKTRDPREIAELIINAKKSIINKKDMSAYIEQNFSMKKMITEYKKTILN